MRVVQVNCFMDGEGLCPEELLQTWPTLHLVAEAAARAGAEMTVLQASRTFSVYRHEDVTYWFVPEPRLRTGCGPGLRPGALAAEARRRRPDVIHFHGLDFPLHLRALCGVGAPVLVQDHASRAGARLPSLRRWSLEKAAAVAFTSWRQAEPFWKAGELPFEMPVMEIAESSTPFTAAPKDEARARTGVYGDPALLWVGHFNANKDPLTIIHAVRRALDVLPGLHLWCAYGAQDLLPQVEAALESDPLLAAHVHLLGRVTHKRVETLCRACDAFLLGSHREGSGYALLEAMACGLTPLVSDIPSFRRLTDHGAVGALAPPGDADAFARNIIDFARAPRREAQAKVLHHFTDHLSPQALGRQLVTAYEAIAGRSDQE